MPQDYRPQRIVCLTAETTEVAFAVGAGERVVGVTGYAVRPPEARKKPRVAAFSTAHVDRILALKPDLVLGFSDLQAGIAQELIKAGATVLITNQRTLAETLAAVVLVGSAVGEPERARQLADGLAAEFAALREHAAGLPRRPRVYFEEWDEPLITGIGWVSEIVELCGGEDAFPELRGEQSAARRIVTADDVIARAPELIVASWCGKKARLEKIAARPGWDAMPAVANGHVYEIKSADILQPGPSLLHGAREMARLIGLAAGAS